MDRRVTMMRADPARQSPAQMLNAISGISTDGFTWLQAEQMYA
jgi:hypothetical protein